MTAINQVSARPLAAAPDDYFQSVVIVSLLSILKDPALSSLHHAVIEAIMSIFKTQGLKCVGYLPQVRHRPRRLLLFLELMTCLDYPCLYICHPQRQRYTLQSLLP